MDFKKGLRRLKHLFLRFWRSENTKVSIVRDVVVAFLFVFIIVLAMWIYTGQWFGTPMVAIESGSMMHNDEPFGRLGTIDAGDMVLLVKVDTKEDVVPRGSSISGALAQKDTEHFFYGNYGDVIIYRPYGDTERDQIIHRAICWVEYHEDYDTYTVEAYNITNESYITINEIGLRNYRPSNSGFITKGDNPNTNQQADQTSPGICLEPIKVEWISGKARSELPWVGTINLLFNDLFSGKSTVKNVPGDSLICLVLLIGFLISIPVSMDIYTHFKTKKEKKKETIDSMIDVENRNRKF